ncbi:Transposase [Shigella dysenteriae 1617]|uniref:Transposase n=1 Tax=Shigella dysenteriae 1617 TaxID=754093 RepID=A0A0A6ZY66_SHIDY|nr:Transposase [Shigella dysenteriae 1617]
MKNTCSTNWKHHPVITSDGLGRAYGREVPKDKHLTGKIFTQRIERNNLTLRTRIKPLGS